MWYVIRKRVEMRGRSASIVVRVIRSGPTAVMADGKMKRRSKGIIVGLLA